MFVQVTKKYISLRNDLHDETELPFELNRNYDLMMEIYNKNPLLYANNTNTVPFILNTEYVLSFTDCTDESFDSPYRYYYVGSKTKIILKNHISIYVTDKFEEIMHKII